MKSIFTLILILNYSIGVSQSIFDWSSDYELRLTDFLSPQTEINEELNSYSISSGANMDFSFHMNTYEFMFTKNFNAKVKTIFNRNAAVITSPDSLTAAQLLKFGRYSFDLTELYTRKFRREMYEKKGVFSDVNFFRPIFNKLQEEMNAESARVLKNTNLGNEENLLRQEHVQVLIAIDSLSDFCLECKPPKKNKKKKR